ncbi:MAG: bifunctional pyr operon transcriptional regulator/uracil phosphoribosyltransferase PyrR [Thermaerobacter sp.]|nr:bifunctional pyr operon transcriptional regulator/uracil phosphoribosyltransferase PyrR [Thermaerobacter sp.]
MRRALWRMAHEILEQQGGAEDLVLVGIPSRGLPLAQRIARLIEQIEGIEPPVGQVDIGPYRDDGRAEHRQALPTVVAGKSVVLCDDVLHTGRTVRAALDAIVDWGRPRRVSLLVLVDRGHRELPIRPDFVGKNVPTAREEHVFVHLTESDGVDEVVIERDN